MLKKIIAWLQIIQIQDILFLYCCPIIDLNMLVQASGQYRPYPMKSLLLSYEGCMLGCLSETVIFLKFI